MKLNLFKQYITPILRSALDINIWWLILIILLNVTLLLEAQNSNYQTYQYTVDEGLPSNECHDIVQDSSGYIWIATDRGLVKWDGYSFKVYGVNEGLTDLSCLKLFKDHESNIWISTFSGRIFKYVYSQDTIELYKYDHIRNQVTGSWMALDQLVVSESGDLAFSAWQFGQNVITNDGELIRNVKESLSKNVLTSMFGEVFISTSRDASSLFSFYEMCGPSSFRLLNTVNINLDYDNLLNNQSSAYVLNDKTWILSIFGFNYIWNKESGISSLRSKMSINDVSTNSKDEIFTLETLDKKVKLYQSLHHVVNNDFESILEGVAGSRLLIDRANNLWITSLDKGLFYLVKSNIEKIDNRSISQLVRCNNNNYTIDDKNIFSEFNFDVPERSVCTFSEEVRDVCCDSLKNKIIISENRCSIFDIENEDLAYVTNKLGTNKNFIANSASIASNGCYLFSQGFQLFRLCDNSELGAELMKTKGRFPFRYTDFIELNNRYYASSLKGLYEIVDTGYTKINLGKIHPEIRINDLKEISGELILATGGSGVLFWDGSKMTNNIDQTDGLISNNVEKVSLGKNENLFVITKQGLSILEKQNDSGNYSVTKNYDSRNGLPTNEIADVVQFGDSLLVGTSKGLALIKDVFSDELPGIEALIETVEINSVLRNDYNNLKLGYSENDIRISYIAIDFQQYGKIRYRYKLNNSIWTETPNTSVSFGSLEPNSYSFQVQAQNIDGIWGSTSSVEFRIYSPWWSSWWFLTICLLSFFLAGFLINAFRLRSLLKKAGVEEELRNLEMSALRAQMNPHFIFNCLNSIQRYIMNNEKESAMNYLSSFAKLVRQTLNASIDASLCLTDEIEMLETYLQLEKLRFKNRFTYNIELDRTLDLDDTIIPPLLIQPFVENAIIHGMSGVNQGGVIEIAFKNTSEHHITVTVQDNGSGAPDIAMKNDYKSVGMSITSKRLKLLNAQKSEKLIVQTNYSDQGGNVELLIRKVNN